MNLPVSDIWAVGVIIAICIAVAVVLKLIEIEINDRS